MKLDPRRARVFGSLAADYQRWRPGYPDAAVDWLVPPGARRIADVAAGTGKLTAALLDRRVQVVALEPDPAMLTELCLTCPGAQPVLATAEALPLPDASVDAALVAQAWHWFDHDTVLAELRRVVRTGGWLGLVWNSPDPQAQWERDLDMLDPDVTADRFAGGIPGMEGLTLEEATFSWQEPMTPEAMRGQLSTHSALILMAPAERMAALATAAEIVAAEMARTGAPAALVSRATYCVRVRL